MPGRHRVLLALGLSSLSIAPAAAEPRVVAVGDLHGDYGNTLAVLRLAGLVDANAAWSGGDAVLVQTGDYTDRGPDSKEIMDLLARLEREASGSGGRVVVLLGNHEVMNLQGDWRYVHPGDVEHFGGATARAAALSPDGTYGRWLASRPIVAKVGNTVFAHGGVSSRWAADGIDPLNDAAAKALFAAPGGVLGPDGPLWYRGFVEEAEPKVCGDLERSLTALGASRMVVGHTTRGDGRVEARCHGRLAVIDVGLSSAYGGNLAAWEMTNADARALYPEGPADLEDPP